MNIDKIEELQYIMTLAIGTKDFHPVFELLKKYPLLVNECYGPGELKENSVLLDAIYFNEPNIVLELLKIGADPNKACSNDTSIPLIDASEYGHISCVKYLLDYGANPNITSVFGETPLVVAKEEGHVEIVKMLKFAMK